MADGIEVSHSKLPEHLISPDRSNENYFHPPSERYFPDSSVLHSKQREDSVQHTRVWPLILAVAITAIVVGAAVGGGIGSQLGGAKHWYVRFRRASRFHAEITSPAQQQAEHPQ